MTFAGSAAVRGRISQGLVELSPGWAVCAAGEGHRAETLD